MPCDSFKHHRRSIRLKGYDYTQPGAYYATIGAYGRLCIFGEIAGGVMRLNDYGEIARAEWLKTPSIRPEIALDEFQIMPDHIHAIIQIMDGAVSVGANGNAPGDAPRTNGCRWFCRGAVTAPVRIRWAAWQSARRCAPYKWVAVVL
jgi:hypothetical protein